MSIKIRKEEEKTVVISEVTFKYLQKSTASLLRFILSHTKNGDIGDLLSVDNMTKKENMDFMYEIAKELMTGWDGVEYTVTDEPVPFNDDNIMELPLDIVSEFAMKTLFMSLDDIVEENKKESREVKNS